MNLIDRHARLPSLFALAALLSLSACSDDGGSEDSDSDGQTETGDGDGDGDSDAGSDSDAGDGDGDTSGDGDGDTSGDGDGDTSGDGDGDTSGDGDGDTSGDGDGDTSGDGDGDPSGDGDGDPDGCGAQDAEAIGDCDAIVGIAWNGEQCIALSGCECAGPDCDEVFDNLEDCEAAFADCFEVGGCAGLDQVACENEPSCQVITGRLLVDPPNPNVGWCAGDIEYLGCSSELGCGDAISFACPDGNEEDIFQTNDTCLPDDGWSACQAPTDDGFYEPC